MVELRDLTFPHDERLLSLRDARSVIEYRDRHCSGGFGVGVARPDANLHLRRWMLSMLDRVLD